MAQPERESMNFRLPKPIAEALRKAASPQPGFTATDIVIRGLLHELGEIQGVEQSTETRLQKLESELILLRSNINKRDSTPTDSRIEEKLEAINNRVGKLEGALSAIQNNAIASNNRQSYRKYSGNPYNQSGKPAQIAALSEQKLALRLNVNIPTLQEKQETLTPKEFAEWSKNRDRGKYSWCFQELDGLYHPKKTD
ncbi:MAG: hypothetical protein HC815_35475 [Richelia sp. RM1_1_1]|nr:hypothetical protein [Richelia sp. RM1_1_1]